MDLPIKIKKIIRAFNKEKRGIIVVLEDNSVITCKNHPETLCFFTNEPAPYIKDMALDYFKKEGYEIKEEK